MKTKKKSLKKSQVWVETTIYTLIGLTIIAILLSIVTPQIEKIKDRNLIEQTITALETLHSKILETEQAAGNIRVVNFRIAKGKLEINTQKNSIIYVLENTKLEMSEPGEEIRQGNVIIKTEKFGARFKISLTIVYDNLNLTYNNQKISKVLQAGTTPYKIKIENIGDQGVDEKVHIDFSVL